MKHVELKDGKTVLNHFKNFIKEIAEYFLKNGVEITKYNIHMYYEFMCDEDLMKLSDLFLSQLLLARQCLVVKDDEIFPTLKHLWWENVTIKSMPYTITASGITGYKDIGRTMFGVKDTLKPIEEYIKEIKESEAYLSYKESMK